MNRTAPIVAAAAATTTLGPTPGEKTTKSLHFTVRLQHLFIKQLHSTAQHLLLFLDAHELLWASSTGGRVRMAYFQNLAQFLIKNPTYWEST